MAGQLVQPRWYDARDLLQEKRQERPRNREQRLVALDRLPGFIPRILLFKLHAVTNFEEAGDTVTKETRGGPVRTLVDPTFIRIAAVVHRQGDLNIGHNRSPR